MYKKRSAPAKSMSLQKHVPEIAIHIMFIIYFGYFGVTAQVTFAIFLRKYKLALETENFLIC